MDEANQELADERREGAGEPTVVGIGASAGGLAALKLFFEQIPADSGLIFVVVVHLSPEHKSMLADLLQPTVRFPVQQVTATIPLEPNNVYVIPPNANLEAIDTHLRLSKLEEQRRARSPIDHFFRTLAATHDGHSIGVVLTGTGSDGTLGLREIKAKGGLILVQDPNEAEFDGMPQSAIATGVVDRVLPITEIAAAILRLSKIHKGIPFAEKLLEPPPPERMQLPKVLAILRTRTDRDFSRYKPATILRRIARRMQLSYIEDFEQYVELLREKPEEARALADDLLITVTSFFRDPDVFEKLRRDVVPRLFRDKGPNEIVRAWSVGCATGEEAYSIAMLLLEESSHMSSPPRLQIFASDLHRHALDGAREGLYPGDIQTDVSAERLDRFFRKENGGYRICKEVRDLVVFAPHNLLGDPPFSRMDLITCRNLMIYLDRSVQRDVIDLFHYALCPNGYLLLGTAETTEAAELFRTEDKKLCLFQRRNVPAPEPRLPVFPLTRLHLPGETATKADNPVVLPAPPTMHEVMLERYAPPSILVSPENRILHLSEHAGRFLTHPGGEVTSSVLRIVREELRIELQALLQAARDKGEAADSKPITLQLDGNATPVVIRVRPSQESSQTGFVLVFFEEFLSQNRRAETNGKRPAQPVAENDVPGRIADLEADLHAANQRLQIAIEEYETSREEMKAANEEMQSTNEELRSTMEELETSKEELQSINEELQTVNQENRHKVDELSQLTGDLQNLLAATDIATLFLDRDLRILRFTPRLAKLFNIRITDKGRPISDLTHRLGYAQLQTDAQGVLESLVPIEHEIRDEDGRWYLTRVLPYRSADQRIEGVVITFIDITALKNARDALREGESRFRALLTAGNYPIYRMSPDWRTMYQLDGQNVLADTVRPIENWAENYHLPEDRPAIMEVVRHAIETKSLFELEHRVRLANGGIAWVLSRAVPMFGLDGEIVEWFGATADITARKEAEEALRASEEHTTFLLKVSDTLRKLTNAADIQKEACELLADKLSVDRAYYVELDEAAGTARVERDCVRGDAPSLRGEHRIADFAWSVDILRKGAQHIVNDTRTSALVPIADRAALASLGILACMGTPIIKGGQLIGAFCVTTSQSRDWNSREIDLLRDVGERLWEAVERARAQTALTRSEEQYRALFTSMDQGFCTIQVLFDEQGRAVDYVLLETNAAFERQTGLRNVAGKRVRELLPNVEPFWFEQYGRIAKTGEAMRFEHEAVAVGFFYDVYAFRIGAPEKNRVAVLFNDISERKRAEKAIRESEEHQRALLEGIPQLVWRSRNDGYWTWSSPQWQSFTGQTQEESQERGWLDAIHPDDVEETMAAWSKAQAAQTLDVEYRIRNAATGLYRCHHTRSVPLYGEQGEIVEWLGTSTDIEDLKRAEHARRNLEEQFRLFVDNVQEYGLVQTDAAGRVTHWNPGAERMFGFTAEEMSGRDFGTLLTEAEQEAAVFPHELAHVAEGHRNEDARWFQRKDGSQFWARWITEPIQDESGHFLGLAKIMKDETEREQTAAFTKDALAEKEELLKEVHHRVKNNLQVITSLLNLQADRIKNKQTLIAFDEARNRVSSIATIHELLYQSGSLSAINLAEYASKFAPSLVEFYGMQQRVRVEISGDGAALELERAVPYGLLLNELLSNALKHAFADGRHGTIRVALDDDEKAIVLRVIDDGVGIPAGFDAEKATSLGMKLVQRLARQLKGTAKFESSEAGTTATVLFPRTPAPAKNFGSALTS